MSADSSSASESRLARPVGDVVALLFIEPAQSYRVDALCQRRSVRYARKVPFELQPPVYSPAEGARNVDAASTVRLRPKADIAAIPVGFLSSRP
jgi:hypothetical protein